MPHSLQDVADALGNLLIKIEDGGDKPYVLIKNWPTAKFPPALAKETMVTFNLLSTAVNRLVIDAEGISFEARFNGKVEQVYAPLNAVLEVFEKNSGKRYPLQQVIAKADAVEELEEQLIPAIDNPQLNERDKFKLLLLEGGGQGDGKPRGKLRLCAPLEAA